MITPQAAISAGTADSLIQGGGIARSPGVATAAFEIGRDHPLVSLVSMVAPSPDWFVGVSALSLFDEEARVLRHHVCDAPEDFRARSDIPPVMEQSLDGSAAGSVFKSGRPRIFRRLLRGTTERILDAKRPFDVVVAAEGAQR